MFSSHWPHELVYILKLATFVVGMAEAIVAWRAASLWLAASGVRIPEMQQTVVSYDDVPALGILEAQVSASATQAAYGASSALNARAARWTAVAAILTAIATVLGAT